MDKQRQNITLGTAGHIDHGKTALIRLLTGCETDRLKTEKERGMSIELGFAPCLVSGMEFGIVDVPGHENFIKTMVAGASGIDGCILVVAADDGVMPQTREHMDILTLLGIEHGVVVLSKIDCVRPERVVEVTEQIKQYLVGTFLEGAPVLSMSSITGEGFNEFYESLKELVASIQPKTAKGVFRVPIERAFSAKGYGTIVAGIPVAGAVEVGTDIVLLPQGTKGRVRAIQVYGHESPQAMAGECAAINVPQWEQKDVARGHVVTVGDYFAPAQWYLCKLKLLDHERAEFKNAGRAKFHTGTSETTGAVYLFQESPLGPGQECLVQIRLNDAIVAGPGDRFILRALSPMRTIGGGIVIEALPKRLKRTHPEVLTDIAERAKAVMSIRDFVEYGAKSSGFEGADEKQLSLRAKVPLRQLQPVLAGLVEAGRLLQPRSKLYLHIENAQRMQQGLLDVIGDFHRHQPESPGISREQLLTDLKARKEIIEGVIESMLTAGTLVQRKGLLALPDHRERFSDAEQELLSRIESVFKKQLFNPPNSEDLAGIIRTAPAEVERVLRILIEQQRLIKIDRKLFFHTEAVAEAKKRLVDEIQTKGELESVQFKYLLDTTRKYAIPLLDYFDKIGVTRRVGYTRLLR